MSKLESLLHTAICQAVALMNISPEVMQGRESREAWNILRQALLDYANAFMDEPVTESERTRVAAKHQKAARRAAAKGAQP